MPQMFHVHAKFYDINENGDEPAMDIPRIVRQFVEGGYQGTSPASGRATRSPTLANPTRSTSSRSSTRSCAAPSRKPSPRRRTACLTIDRHMSNATELATLREEVAAVRAPDRPAAQDRGAVENVFNRYMYLHNAFQDEQIIPLWVKRGTEGIRARYTNAGEYTEYDSVIRYHQGRPSPVGKLILHATTTPVIEVAADGKTAKGVWLMAGTESGLTDPEVAKEFPDMYSPGEVLGKKVWAHWVWCKYAIDFLKQDGEWKIWKFRCYELARAPFEENWISFGLEEPGRVRPRPDVLRRRRQTRLHAPGRPAGARRRTTRTARRPCRSSSRSRRCRTTPSSTPSTDLTARTRSPPWPPTTPSSPRRTSLVATTRSPSRCSCPGTAASGCRRSMTSPHPSTASRSRRTTCASS